ncbi:glucose-6-phosphate dehydrogenase [Sporolactobacillus sp. CPB3-1]|uniref:Glucose-6-phosphate 1-dehydrogenase n=1 Tax=Sporolactobacillus mangiferae TaxID=2940498 RepID=A0ABT0MA99_9BACL|nr:glucose-6-phosphate dehydrogenase [Sporolactobacillus mangiferae]MCL1631788.1 glucose-6-phosphate dehydrogenase [Sporolactobacillus mangiferae]
MTETAREPVLIFLFGATGDLARRKLYSALYRLYTRDQEFAVIGLARRTHTDETYRDLINDSLPSEVGQRKHFLERFYYRRLDITRPESFASLSTFCEELDARYHLHGNRIFYLSLAPCFFAEAAKQLKKSGLAETKGWKRLVIEKPFGHNKESSKELNDSLLHAFNENEIYRIDHYLGKEMVQNIEVLRFANPIFEAIWNRRYISNVQITLSETLGVGDRANYYDQTGALLDMVQNHIMQLLTLVAMEPPVRLETNDVRYEKVKVLKAVRPMNIHNVTEQIVRGQYSRGIDANRERLRGYLDENNIRSDSETETFVAAQFMIDNYRWQGVPFYIRTGKRMSEKATQIVIQFKKLPKNPYFHNVNHVGPNLLVIYISPDEGLSLKLNVKETGETGNTIPISMKFRNNALAMENMQDAYERLIADCIKGDSTNFTRWDEVAYSWEIVDSIVDSWKKRHVPVDYYEAGSMGPVSADELLEKNGHHWWPLMHME